MTTTRKSNFTAALRTTILMALLGGLLVAIGSLVGGSRAARSSSASPSSSTSATYWFSDKIALDSAGAKPLEESEAPGIYAMVRDLATRAKLPMPRLYVIPPTSPTPSPPAVTPRTRRWP